MKLGGRPGWVGKKIPQAPFTAKESGSKVQER